MKSKLTEGPVGLQLLKLTLPLVWGVFAVIAFSLADTYFVAQLGTNELAAMSFTFPVVMVLGSVAMGLGIGASSIIARAIGSGDRYRVRRLTTDSLILSLLVVAILAGLGLATINPLFTALGAGPEALPLIRDYMSVWYLGIIFLVVPLVGNSAIRASGNTIVPSLIMTVAAAVNILLDPLLIFGWGDFPPLGIKGAALATVISRAATLVASLAFLHFRERLLLFALPKLKEVWQSWISVLSVGLPAAATNLIVPISVGLLTSLMARYGPEAVAGFGIASRVESFALIAPLALSASIGPFVGQNWGANQRSRVNQALRLSFWFCLAWGGLIAIIVGANASGIAAWFDSEPAVVASAVAYLTTVPLSYGALGIIYIFSSTFNALGKPLPSVAMTLSRMFLLYVPLAYLGSWLFGLQGVFVAACLSNVAVGLGVYIWHSHQSSFKAEIKSAHLSLSPGVTVK
ncbi:MAG: MATE family efflux transporter [Leptolyngbyaceae cyanobacterium MO_188.B28]|nr:MATE family efflux transporter [Leptolyngbyaceae cyanobacterium MO_188.B28]